MSDRATHAAAQRGPVRFVSGPQVEQLRSQGALVEVYTLEGSYEERIRRFLSSPVNFKTWQLFHSGVAWSLCAELRARGTDAVLVGSQANVHEKPEADQRDSVLRVVLSELPQPSELTPWETILEFRRDPEARGKFLRLKHWMNDLAKGDASPQEMEDRLRWLLHEYEEHMRLHRMKIEKGVFESLIVTASEVLENLAKVRWSAAAKAVFALRHRTIGMLEAERQAPGRELAYILQAKSRFGST